MLLSARKWWKISSVLEASNSPDLQRFLKEDFSQLPNLRRPEGGVHDATLLAVLIILYFGSNDATEGKYRNYARRVATSPGPNISRFVLMRLDEMGPFDRIVKSLTRQ